MGTRMAAPAQRPAPTTGLQTQVSRNPSPWLAVCLSAQILSCPGASSHPMEGHSAEEWCLPESLPPQAHAVTGSRKSVYGSPFCLGHSYFMIELNSKNSSWFNLRTAIELNTRWQELERKRQRRKECATQAHRPSQVVQKMLRILGCFYHLSVRRK